MHKGIFVEAQNNITKWTPALTLADAGLGAELAPLSASAGKQLTTPTQINAKL